MDWLIPSLFTFIIYWMSGLRLSAGAFFANWASLILCVLVAQASGWMWCVPRFNVLKGGGLWSCVCDGGEASVDIDNGVSY